MNSVKRRVRAYLIPVLLLAVVCLWTSPEEVQAAGNDTTIFSYLTINMDLTPAAACGIMANMYEESRYIPDIANPSGAYGLCQWMGPRLTRLKNYCAQHKYNYRTVAGQLRFLNYELQTYFPAVLRHMRGVKNTADGAYDAGHYWCYYFEIPGNRSATSSYRGSVARNTMWPRYGSSAIYIRGKGAWNGVQLFWDQPSPYGYVVRRCTTKYGTYTTLAKLGSTRRSFADTTGKKGQPYYYYVAALNAKGGIASKSNKPRLTAPPTLTDPECTVTLNVTKVAYNGRDRKPRATVVYNGKTLTLGTDYTVTYANNRNVGTGTVKVAGTGKYAGSVKKKFTIVKGKQPITASDLTCFFAFSPQVMPVKAEGKLTLTAVDPSVAVFSGTTLQMKKAGRTQVLVNAAATANYLAASTTFDLTIRPCRPKFYSIQDLGSGQALLRWKSYSNAQGTVIQYNTSGDFTKTKKILYVKGSKVSRSATFSKLTRGRTWYFRYADYVTIDGKRLYSKWSKTESVAVK